MGRWGKIIEWQQDQEINERSKSMYKLIADMTCQVIMMQNGYMHSAYNCEWYSLTLICQSLLACITLLLSSTLSSLVHSPYFYIYTYVHITWRTLLPCADGQGA